jgi:hypothetical protein
MIFLLVVLHNVVVTRTHVRGIVVPGRCTIIATSLADHLFLFLCHLASCCQLLQTEHGVKENRSVADCLSSSSLLLFCVFGLAWGWVTCEECTSMLLLACVIQLFRMRIHCLDTLHERESSSSYYSHAARLVALLCWSSPLLLYNNEHVAG